MFDRDIFGDKCNYHKKINNSINVQLSIQVEDFACHMYYAYSMKLRKPETDTQKKESNDVINKNK